MSLISGYVVEPIRVGQSNGTFTQTPDVYVANETAFNAAYPEDETAPRTDYLVMVTSEGITCPGLLEFARFGFTKNEIIDRFAYDAQLGAFAPLKGSAPVEVGVLGADVNDNRLRVQPPVQATSVASAPYRLAVGSTGSGIAWSVVVVATDADFSTPASLPTRTVQLSMETGNLNWRTSDVTTTYVGERVRFQQQQFFTSKESTGRLGFAPTSVAEPALILNPLPGPGQYPRIRFGYGSYLTPAEVTSFTSNPAAGTVQWLRSTGELKFNLADATANIGTPVYYDGVLFANNLSLPSRSLGVVPASNGPMPITITGLPSMSGYDLIFRVEGSSPYYRFPTVTYRQESQFDSKGKRGEVQVDPTTGKVRLSNADRGKFVGKTVTLFIADLPIERGISVRFLRNPVNLDGSLALKDVTAVYSVQGATWADPIIASPQVSLPSLPIEAAAYPTTVHVVQGQGSYVNNAFPDLTVSPQEGLGYFIDYDSATMFFAQRKEDVIVSLGMTSDVVLPDPLLVSSHLVIERGSGSSYQLLVVGDDVLVDTTSGVVSLASTNAALVAGTASIVGSTLTDPQATFITGGVRAGQLVVLTGRGSLYSVVSDPVTETAVELHPQPEPGSKLAYTIYEDREVLADRYFDEVVLVDPSTKVERVYEGVARTLTPKVDYQLQAELGLVQFSDRLLTGEQARITYTVKPPYTMPATEPGGPVTEYARFLIRKEVTLEHPLPTSTLKFNPAGLIVASEPAPAVFRGGRPQKLGVQCTVDTEASEITFLDDGQLTDALPHGAVVNPNERVYIDYYVTQAVGGEKTFTVLQPPLLTSPVTIKELTNEFVVRGDQTARFPSQHLLRIESEQIYLIGSSSYAADADETTVRLYDSGTNPDGFSQSFSDAYSDPKLYVSSGPTPIVPAPLSPAYFVAELSVYEPIARGSNTFWISGDQASSYRIGTVVLFTNALGTFTDFQQVTGVAYDVGTGRTKVMLASNVARQYLHGQQLLLRSLRPVFAEPPTEVQTARIPKLTQPYLVYRQTVGQPGRVLTQAEYTIDETGRVVLVEPLAPNEEISICYTGLTTPAAGENLRVSYTCQIAPSAINGLLGQALIADYYIQSADSFYFRVETMTNFRGEFAAEIAASAASGSSGPRTSNSSQPKLWEQGRKSLYFDERHLANQDRVARAALFFYNDLINSIESFRSQLDGLVVGNNDGPLRFDGGTGRKSLGEPVTNQIDDALEVSDSPPFSVLKRYYEPGPLSRFYPTHKNFFGTTIAIDDQTSTGTEVLGTSTGNVTQVSSLRWRQAWGVVQKSSTGSTLQVDLAKGTEPEFAEQAQRYGRRPFKQKMKCAIVSRDGALVASLVSIVSVADYEVNLSNAVVAPIGATIYQLQTDDSKLGTAPNEVPNMVTHVAGRDYSFNGETGQITYVEPAGDPATNVPLSGLTLYEGELTFTNKLTEPFKFPALFGGIEDDDGALSFPIQSPHPDNEQWKLSAETVIIGSGAIRAPLVTEPKVSTGSVVAPNLYTIVDSTIGSMVPGPQPGGLVRILTGPNSGSGFRRVSSVGSTYVIVTSVGDGGATLPAFVASAGFSYELVVSPNIASGTANGGTVSTLSHSGASFLSTVKVGYTVVLTFGTTVYRRQVTAVNSNTTLTFYPSVPTAVGTATQYRIENSLATYGNRSGVGELDPIQAWDAVLAGLQALYADYGVALDSILAKAEDGVRYFGLTDSLVTSLTELRTSVAALVSPLAGLRAKLAPAQVVAFDGAHTFAMDVLGLDVDAREAQVVDRSEAIETVVEQLIDILANTEKLYDKRYVWIDARINLESGLLVRQELAVKNRLKAQTEMLKQLIKLLAVGGV